MFLSEYAAKNKVSQPPAVYHARRPAAPAARRMTTDEITNLVTALGDLMQVLEDADLADKAQVYSRLGLTLTYHPRTDGWKLKCDRIWACT
jgi:hypothetical protein